MKKNTKNGMRKPIIATLFAVITLFVVLQGVSANCCLYVSIDIKPGSCPNSININSNGVIPVAILTTRCFDATDINPTSVQFGPDRAVHYAREDVDGDGDIDLILHFKTTETGITSGGKTTLTGCAENGRTITGYDCVRVVGKGNGK